MVASMSGTAISLAKVAAELFVFTLKQLVTAEEVDGAMFGRGHEPGAGMSGMPDSGHCSSAAIRRPVQGPRNADIMHNRARPGG